jgi:hypothetical protein
MMEKMTKTLLIEQYDLSHMVVVDRHEGYG